MKKLILVFCLAMTGQIYGQIITGNDYLSWKSDENMSDISYFYMSGMMTGISLSLAYGHKQSFTIVSFSEENKPAPDVKTASVLIKINFRIAATKRFIVIRCPSLIN